ncbi:MAG: transglutaminase family protein [Hyphomicrobiales bacterium]|nr:transglutaminase family protein [Hyphomicrobiales bacterium]MCP5370173.1 transglutaminase family protein [Hyphomicrobiales bacterium]
MRLRVEHETRYGYENPVGYTIQSLRLTPRDHAAQRVLSWHIFAAGTLTAFEDSFGNLTHTLVIDVDHDETVIRVAGEVETTDTNGVLPPLPDRFPLVLYLRPTELTRPDDALRDLVAGLDGIADGVERAHALMNRVRDAIDYRAGETSVTTTAAQALAHGHGVCQDHAHAFITGARLLDLPARYVSGYLMAGNGHGGDAAPPRDHDTIHDASHAWAEVHVEGLGWVGFDAANRQCPTDAYVRLAHGLDYREAAPIRGLRRGGGDERLRVRVSVTQAGEQAQS